MRSSKRVYDSLDLNDEARATHVPWYWRVVAFISSWLIIAGFLAIPPLYDKRPRLRCSTTLISGLAIAALTAGFSLTPLLWFSSRNLSFRADSVFVPGFGSSLLGLVVLVATFLVSPRYEWTIAAIIGVTVASVATLVYALLAAHTFFRISKINNRLQCKSESQLTLAQHESQYTPARGQSVSTAGYCSTDERSGSEQEAVLEPAYWPSRFHQPQHYTDQRRQPRSSGYPDNSNMSTHPHPVPVQKPWAEQTAPIEPLDREEEEEDMTRQQMLKLLLKQTSEQARRNPDVTTFHIDLPRGAREALRNNTLNGHTIDMLSSASDDASTPLPSRDASQMLPKQARQSGSQHPALSGGTLMAVPMSASSIAPTPAQMYPPKSAMQEQVSVPGRRRQGSVQATPADMYGSMWKTREERRSEIEKGKG